MHNFKTLYFPKNRVKNGKATRVNISIPVASTKHGWDVRFLNIISGTTGVKIREFLGDPMLDFLEDKASQEHRSLSNVILSILHDKYNTGALSIDNVHTKTNESSEKGAVGVTFSDSLRKSSFGWYPYVEGFSANYARDALLRDDNKPLCVYDPFGGSGTTQLAASLLGIKSYYSELNPFMVKVCEAKITAAKWARKNLTKFNKHANHYISLLEKNNLEAHATNVCLEDYYRAFPNRDFFEEAHLRNLLAAMEIAKGYSKVNENISALFLIACAANAVACSNMTRRADLRRRRPDEYKNRIVDVSAMISATIRRMMEDIVSYPEDIADTVLISNDAKNIPEEYRDTFDFVLTSPPYLNGTNYFRNTKIELWLMSLIDSEQDLKKYRELTVTGGINDVHEKKSYFKFSSVEDVALKLDIESKDKRIPKMVRHYFSDMYEVMTGVYRSMKSDGKFLLDIGDSKFYGVHVPTHKLLCDVAHQVGFILEHENVLAKRLSRDKSELVQVELVFSKR
ncbi:hypothetical protein [Aeromonas hydrophila]|uniref:hypothetical protein n=1 Tax=Aeromonas hydrophila TaxID=644 RepID=UPI002B48EACE|nr:hypothetical protein [Aeromonas hydrophila]